MSLDRLLELLAEEKRNTPSNYALVVLSEGAKWQGYVPAFERYDASGHVRPPSIAEALKTEIAERLGEESMASDLTYELRSGEPDFVDKLVATTFGNIATDAILAGKHGLMTALVGGTYTLASLPDPTLGPRKVDLGLAIQRAALPAQVCRQAGVADLPDQRGGLTARAPGRRASRVLLGCARPPPSFRAWLHESSLARTMPTDRILTCRYDMTNWSVELGHPIEDLTSRGRPHSPAPLDSGRKGHR